MLNDTCQVYHRLAIACEKAEQESELKGSRTRSIYTPAFQLPRLVRLHKHPSTHRFAGKKETSSTVHVATSHARNPCLSPLFITLYHLKNL